jgi:Pirin C-terminal cupin domain
MLAGGAPLDGPRHVFWNFVSSRRDRIQQAKEDWKADRFPVVPDDPIERIPIPEVPKTVSYP